MGKQEMKRRAAALLEDVVQELADRPTRDEESERLVLVRRPGVDSSDEEAPERTGEGRHGRPMKVDREVCGKTTSTRGRRWHFRAASAGDGRTAW